MSDAFDPYYEWLGIPPREQPVNYYRLLGLNLYETNSQVIANAADRQMAYIRMFQNGAHAKESQTILNEISKARVTLLNETNKRKYDNNLKRQAFRGELRSTAPPVPTAPPAPTAPHVSPAKSIAPVLPDAAGFSNSTAHNLGPISEAERLRLETEIRRMEVEEKAKRSLILTAVAVGPCFLVLLTILVLVINFSRSSSTPTAPSAHEEELADTSEATSQTIEEPSAREGELADTSQKTSQTIKEPSNVAGDRMVKTVNGVEFAFCWCPSGTFMMGSPETEEGRESDEDVKETHHHVTLTKGFWMQETEITQAQWKAVMENNPSEFKGDDLPVENVSWDDCQEFCRKCKDLGLEVQLPTEAQWEYACRAGSTTRYSFGDSADFLYKHCNYCDKSNTSGFYWQDNVHDDGFDKTAPVKKLQPNAWGLYDMHGNIWELCNDWYTIDLTNSSVTDPKGPESGSSRVNRGGSWFHNSEHCRSAIRNRRKPDSRYFDVGFRLSLGQ